MNKPLDRRSALSLGGSAVAAAAAGTLLPSTAAWAKENSKMHPATKNPPGLSETTPAFDKLFPSTRYFEMDSKIVGARFAAWVTVPDQYKADDKRYFPVVYQMDGQLFFPATAVYLPTGNHDPMSPLNPFILISVGYTQEESHAWTWLRVRDLQPPGEPLPDLMAQTLEQSIKAGILPREEGDRYLAMFSNTAADKFLDFLENELHPLMASTFRIDSDDVGLFGDSLGGLFALYVAMRRSKLFKRIGAGSPGMMAENSQIFKLHDQALASKQDYSGRRLHVSIGSREITQQSPYRWLTGRGTTEFLARSELHPLPGLELTSELIPLETHITATVPNWFSFLRACYGKMPEAKSA